MPTAPTYERLDAILRQAEDAHRAAERQLDHHYIWVVALMVVIGAILYRAAREFAPLFMVAGASPENVDGFVGSMVFLLVCALVASAIVAFAFDNLTVRRRARIAALVDHRDGLRAVVRSHFPDAELSYFEVAAFESRLNAISRPVPRPRLFVFKALDDARHELDRELRHHG